MDFIQDLMAGRVGLPMVPRVVERVLAVIRAPDAGFAEITEELEQDPVLGSRVLRLAIHPSSVGAGRCPRSRMPGARPDGGAAFGVTHPMVSAIWADRLGLPRDVVAAIRRVDRALLERLDLEAYVASGRFGTDFDALQSLSVPL